MTEQKSGLENWSYIARTAESRDSIEGFLPLMLSSAGALGVAPFAVVRFMRSDWSLAIIDTVIVIGFVALGAYVYRTRRVRAASIVISLLCIGGAVATVYIGGIQRVYWIYPALMAMFYLIRPREAIVLALVTIAALIPAFLPGRDSFQTATVFITIVVMSAVAYAFSIVTNRQQLQLLQLASKDPLTGAGNRRALENRLDAAVASFRRRQQPVSLIVLDLDHFKAVNDVHGHAAGDRILQSITEIVNLRIRVTDSLYRIGGEEFVVVVDGQGCETASHLAEQLRTLVEANELVPDQSVTISLGVAELQQREAAADWLRRADAALYEAKRAGRNTTSLSRVDVQQAAEVRSFRSPA